jgi:hypothetical protein
MGQGTKATYVLAPLVVLLMMLAGAGRATAAEKNKCGCYRDGAGTCFCDKKAKCGCPGECEPKGCEEKREQQMKREIEAETKKAAEADRKHKSTSVEVKADKTETPKASKEERAVAPAGKKMSATQMKQLGKLLDEYLRANPGARTRNAEELRNELTLTQ